MLPDYSETKRLSQDIPKTQTVDGKGKKLDAEIVLEMLETIPMEFYPDGRPHELHGRANYSLSKQKIFGHTSVCFYRSVCITPKTFCKGNTTERKAKRDCLE